MINDNNLLNQYSESKRIIRQAMKDQQLVLFVGAGASIASGMPTWAQAVEVIADHLSITDRPLDFLRIPQYHYNARGKKEYTQLMRSIFCHGVYLQKHEIHDKIIEFHTGTIITTNYDHLIEQAAEDNSEILSVVSKDADIPYRRGGRELIKMHGDFENDNFVLKEDDYLAYSRNFMLIENYVKSIIGTKVVLFIGYSFNDPDVKQIFSWVKDILGGDFQRAYLIESGKPYDVNEAEYFKNFGINVLYAAVQLQKEYGTGLTNNLLLMLKWLLEKDIHSGLDTLYKDLSPLSDLAYVSDKYVKPAFSKLGMRVGDGRLSLYDISPGGECGDIFKALVCEQYRRLNSSNFWTNEAKADSENIAADNENGYVEKDTNGIKCEENRERIEEYLKSYKPDGNTIDKVRSILDILYKSSIQVIEIPIPRKTALGWWVARLPIDNPDAPDWMGRVNTFEFDGLRILAEQNATHLVETKPDLYMKQGYIHFILGEYLASYNDYKNAKTIYYKRREYVKYFIAEFNRVMVGRMVCGHAGVSAGVEKDDVSVVKEELESVDLDRTFQSIPLEGLSRRALKDIYTFNVAYTLFQDAYRSSEKVREQAEANYEWFSGVSAFSGMRENISDYYNYISLNFLAVNHYREHIDIFKVYFQSILGSVMTADMVNTNPVKRMRAGNIHADNLWAFDLMVALKFVGLSELEKMTKALASNLPLNDDAMNYLLIVLSNCTKRMPRSIFIYDNTFWKVVTFLGRCDLNVELADKALEKLNELIAPVDYRTHGNKIIRFFDNVHKQGLINEGNAKYIDTFLRKELTLLTRDKAEAPLHRRLIVTAMWLLKENGKIFDDENIISGFLSDEIRSLCIDMYPYLGEKSQGIIYEKYKIWKYKEGSKDFEIYYDLLNAGIITADSLAEQEIYSCYKSLEEKKDDRDDDSITQGMTIYPCQDPDAFLYKMLDLYINGLIIDREACKDLILDENVEGGAWLVDIGNYDYDQFEVRWLSLCTSNLLHQIADDASIRAKIRERFIIDYKAGNVNQDLVDIYFNYFAD